MPSIQYINNLRNLKKTFNKNKNKSFSVSINPMQPNGTYSDNLNISVDTKRDVVKSIRFYIDNKYIGVLNNVPYNFFLNSKILSNGIHVLRVYITWNTYDKALIKSSDISYNTFKLNIYNNPYIITIGQTVYGNIIGGKNNLWKLHVPINPPPTLIITTAPVLQKNIIGKTLNNPTNKNSPINTYISYENCNCSNIIYDYKNENNEYGEIVIDSPQTGDYYICININKGFCDYELNARTSLALGNQLIDFNVNNSLYTHWENGNKFAIVVGISDYLFINDLSYCDDDAVSWCDFLSQKQYQIKLLGDLTSEYGIYTPIARATENNIRQYVKNLSNIVKENDKVVFISSGHGSGDGNGYSWLCCLDENNSPLGEYDCKEIANDFCNITKKGAYVFIFCDNCFSGGIIDDVLNLCNNDHIFIVTTCTQNGFGYDESSYKHGAWTYAFLIKTLMDTLKNQNPNLNDVFDTSIKIYQYNGGDTPQKGGNGKWNLE